MSAPRFHAGDGALRGRAAGDLVELPGHAAHHALRALRLAVGDMLTLFDGGGGEWSATLVHAGKHAARAALDVFAPIEREQPVALTLAMAVIASDPMDSAVRRAVELGVAAIVPVECARTQGVLRGDRAARRLAHWQQVAISACEQCGRNRIPLVGAVTAFADWCAAAGSDAALLAPGAAQSLAAWGTAHAQRSALQVAIGPEGGYSADELARATAHGIAQVGLGARVLRAETAALAALATLAAIVGDAR